MCPNLQHIERAYVQPEDPIWGLWGHKVITAKFMSPSPFHFCPLPLLYTLELTALRHPVSSFLGRQEVERYDGVFSSCVGLLKVPAFHVTIT